MKLELPLALQLNQPTLHKDIELIPVLIERVEERIDTSKQNIRQHRHVPVRKNLIFCSTLSLLIPGNNHATNVFFNIHGSFSLETK